MLRLIKTVSSDMKPVSSSDDEYNAFKNTIFQYFACSLLIPIRQTANQFEQQYRQRIAQDGLKNCFDYSYVVACCPTLQKAFRYADAHVASRSTCFCALFGLLVQKADPEKGTYDEDVILTSMMSSRACEQDTQPAKDEKPQTSFPKDKGVHLPADQVVQCLDSETKLFLLSDYMSVFPHRCLSADFIETLFQTAGKQYLDPGELHDVEQLILIALFRAFDKAQSCVQGDRNVVHFMIHYYYRFTDLQFYLNVSSNPIFPSIYCCRLPQCVLSSDDAKNIPQLVSLHKSDLEFDNSADVDFDSKQLIGSDQSIQSSIRMIDLTIIKNLIRQTLRKMLDPQKPIISITEICDIARANEQFECAVIEGLLIVLETTNYLAAQEKVEAPKQLSGATKYMQLCYVFSAILSISDPLQMQSCFEQFVRLHPLAKLVVMDCVASYALNRRLTRSVIVKEVLKEDMTVNMYSNLDSINNKIKWQAENINKIVNRCLSDDF